MEGKDTRNIQFSSVAPLSRVQLCNPRSRSIPGLPVHHRLPDPTQTHVRRVGDAVQPSRPLPSLLLLPPVPPSIRALLQRVTSSHQVATGQQIQPQRPSFQD